MAPGLRAVIILALCAVSLILLGWQVSADSAIDFARDNILFYSTRQRLLASFLAAGVLVAVLSLSYVALAGSRGLARVKSASSLAAPLLLAAFVPPLLVPAKWEDTLPTVVAIAAFTLVLERLTRVSFREMAFLSSGRRALSLGPSSRRARRIGLATVGACVVFYAVYMSRYTIFNHRRFGTYGFDLGQYDNLFWSTLHGHPLRCAPYGILPDWHYLSGHAHLSVFFLLPFYAIRPNAETLLIMQASFIAIAALPIYLFAARRLPALYACLIATCYLLYPPLHGANFYDFHWQPIAATFTLFTIYFVDRRRWVWAAVMYTVAIGCREDTSVGLTVLGLYFALSGYRVRAGIVMAVAGAAYFVAMRFFIMPAFGSGWFQEIYKDLYPQPDGPHSFGGIIQTLMTNPMFVFHSLLTQDKFRYFLLIVTPLGFLPLRRSYLLPAFIPGAIFTLLTTAYPPTIDTAFQYSADFPPYLFCAAVLALAAYRSDRQATIKLRSAVIALSVGTFLCTLQWGALSPRRQIRGGFSVISLVAPSAADEQKGRDLAELNAMVVPAEATVAVTEEELPHVSNRLNVLTLKSGTAHADYLLYGTSSYGAGAASSALAAGEYVTVAQRPGLVLLKRKQ